MTIAPHLTVDELEQRYRRVDDPIARSQWQMVWLLARGLPTGQVARVTGYSVRWVQEIAPAIGPAPRPSVTGAMAIPVRPRFWMRRSRSSCAKHWPVRPRTVGLVVPQRGGLDEPETGATGERTARLGVDAPPRVHAAAAPPRETRADPVAQEAFKKGGLPRRLPR